MILEIKDLERLEKRQLIEVIFILSSLMGEGDANDMPDGMRFLVSPKSEEMLAFKEKDRFLIDCADYIPNTMDKENFNRIFRMVGFCDIGELVRRSKQQ